MLGHRLRLAWSLGDVTPAKNGGENEAAVLDEKRKTFGLRTNSFPCEEAEAKDENRPLEGGATFSAHVSTF